MATREVVSDGIIIGALVFQTCLLLKQNLHVVLQRQKVRLEVAYTSARPYFTLALSGFFPAY